MSFAELRGPNNLLVERITQSELDALSEYSFSLPTGKPFGRRWKRNVGTREDPVWVTGTYGKEKIVDGEEVIEIDWRDIEIVTPGLDISAHLARTPQ